MLLMGYGTTLYLDNGRTPTLSSKYLQPGKRMNPTLRVKLTALCHESQYVSLCRFLRFILHSLEHSLTMVTAFNCITSRATD